MSRQYLRSLRYSGMAGSSVFAALPRGWSHKLHRHPEARKGSARSFQARPVQSVPSTVRPGLVAINRVSAQTAVRIRGGRFLILSWPKPSECRRIGCRPLSLSAKPVNGPEGIGPRLPTVLRDEAG